MKKLAAALALLFWLAAPALASQGSGCMPTVGTISGLTLVNDINAGIAALISSNSGATAPATDCSAAAVKGQLWVDTSTTPNSLKIYDGSTTWLPIGYLDATNHIWSPPIGGGTNTLASAGTTDLWSVRQGVINVTGVTTITALANASAVPGTVKLVKFAGALTLTYNATSLILPTAASITTVAGDYALCIALTSTNVQCVAYFRADGTALASAVVLTGATTFSGVTTPTILGVSTNNYNPTNLQTNTVLRISASLAINITGLTAPTANKDEAFKILHNIGSFAITLTSNDTNSTAANRFNFVRPVVLYPGQSLSILYDNTTTNWRLNQLTVDQAIAGGFKNLVVTNNGASTTQTIITADALTAENADGVAVRLTSVSVTCDLAVSGAGGLDTGTMAADTWYSHWVFFNPTTNAKACVISTSATAPATVSGYTFKVRVGWMRTDPTAPASTKWLRIKCFGRTCQYVVLASSTTPILPAISSGTQGTYSATAPTWTTPSVTTFVPTATASAIYVTVVGGYKGGSQSNVLVAPSDQYAGSENASGNAPPFRLNINFAYILTGRMALEATTIAYVSSNAGGGVLCLGWEDNI